MVKFGSHNKTMLYPNLSHNKVCYCTVIHMQVSFNSVISHSFVHGVLKGCKNLTI